MHPKKTITPTNTLCRRIASGVYAPNELLPTGHELAREFGISYVTATKVYRELETRGYLRRVRGRGTYTMEGIPFVDSPGRVVTLLSPSHQGFLDILKAGLKHYFVQNGWEVFVQAQKSGEITDQFRERNSYYILAGKRPAFLENDFLLDYFRARLVVLGYRTDAREVSCVTADEPQSVRLAMEHLYSNGIQSIAMIRAHRDHLLEIERASVWRSITLDHGKSPALLWDMGLRPEQPVADVAESFFENLWNSGAFAGQRGVICPDAEVSLRLFQWLRERGKKVPQDIQIVSIGGLADSSNGPSLSYVDPNLEGHIHVALDILERKLRGESDEFIYHICQPRFVKGETTAKI